MAYAPIKLEFWESVGREPGDRHHVYMYLLYNGMNALRGKKINFVQTPTP